MSGGYFDYDQYRIDGIAEKIRTLIDTNDAVETDANGWTFGGREYCAETIAEFRKAVQALELAAVYAQRVDWLVSCDDSEDCFHSRLADELAKLKGQK